MITLLRQNWRRTWFLGNTEHIWREHKITPKRICSMTLRGLRNEHLTWSKAFCTWRVGLWRVVMAILRLAVETQALSADDALDKPLRRHQRDFLWRHIFLYQWWTGTVCHHDVVLASRNVCRRREEQTVINSPSRNHVDVTRCSLYLNCPCRSGTVGQTSLRPVWSAAPTAPPASQTPAGPVEPWTGCSGDAWLEKIKEYIKKASPFSVDSISLLGFQVVPTEEQIFSSLTLMLIKPDYSIQVNYKNVKHVEAELDLTILRWRHPAPHQPAAGSSCSWAACCLCSSLSPTCVTHMAPRWTNTANTFLYDSAGLRWANSGKLPYTEEGTNREERHTECCMIILELQLDVLDAEHREWQQRKLTSTINLRNI